MLREGTVSDLLWVLPDLQKLADVFRLEGVLYAEDTADIESIGEVAFSNRVTEKFAIAANKSTEYADFIMGILLAASDYEIIMDEAAVSGGDKVPLRQLIKERTGIHYG